MGQGQATLMLVICAAMWSFAGTWIKLVDFHPIVINSARGIFAVLSILVYFAIKKIKISVQKEAIIGGVILASVMTVTVCALSLTTAANAIILQYMSPVYVLLISVIFFKQKARGKDILVVIFSILGVALFFIDKVEAGSLLGNILGICGGILFAISFIYNNRAKVNPLHIVFWGCLFSTIIGIPFGIQCFKIASFVFTPFGRQVEGFGGPGSCLLNLLWILFFGWELALSSLAIGLVYCITIVGIPLGVQSFKLARLAIWPFGASI